MLHYAVTGITCRHMFVSVRVCVSVSVACRYCVKKAAQIELIFLLVVPIDL